MDFKQHFLYQTDYQHWANDALLGALDRLDDAARKSPQRLFFGSLHNHVDHLTFFYRKWLARLRGENPIEHHTGTPPQEWRELKAGLRQETRGMQRWLERQPQDFIDTQIAYRRTLSQETRKMWVRDALTHIFTYAALERGQIAAIAANLGAPHPDMLYASYRLEMGNHLENLRRQEPAR